MGYPKRGLLFLLVMVFLISFVSPLPPFETNVNTAQGLQIYTNQFSALKQNQDFSSHIHMTNITNGKEMMNDEANCTVHTYRNTGSHLFVLDYIPDPANPEDWEVEIGGGNFSEVGEYAFRIFCDAGDVGGAVGGTINVTPDGKPNNPTKLISNILLLLAVIVLTLIIYYTSRKTNFEEWDKGIKSGKKNAGQLMASGIAYSLFKNTFIWVYFLGWLMVLVLKDITFNFGSAVIYDYFVIIANVYSLGLILAGVFMIGFTYDYMKRTFETLSDNNWGLGGENEK